METTCQLGLEAKLDSFVLEFPSAVAGVRWSTVQQAYASEHGHEPIPADLHATAKGSLLHWVEEGARGDVGSDVPQDLIVKVADSLALDCHPGLLATWPALYSALCAAVRSYRSLDSRGLLLSRLHPRLDAEEINAQDGVTHRNMLRSWLDLACWKKGSSNGQEGLCYRDENGAVRRLRKVGHLVKAVIHWRQQHCQLLSREGHQAGALFKALLPELQLEFSKANNNLVLYCVEDGYGETNSSAAAASTVRKAIDLDNPFKWTLPRLVDGPANTAESTSLVGDRLALQTLEPRPSMEEEADAKTACRFELLQCWLGLMCLLAQHKHVDRAEIALA